MVGVDFEYAPLLWAHTHYRKKNLYFAAADIEELSFASGSFDGVCFFETIHLIKDHLKALREINRVMKKGGMLCVSTRRGQPGQAAADAVHIRSFTPSALESALCDNGFKDIELYGMDRPKEVYALERKLAEIRKFDTGGLRRLIPRPIISMLTFAVSLASGIRPPQKLTAKDFVISRDAVGSGCGILALCRKAA